MKLLEKLGLDVSFVPRSLWVRLMEGSRGVAYKLDKPDTPAFLRKAYGVKLVFNDL